MARNAPVRSNTMQSIIHERCDTMEFKEDSIDKLANQFHILMFKMFSFLRRF